MNMSEQRETGRTDEKDENDKEEPTDLCSAFLLWNSPGEPEIHPQPLSPYRSHLLVGTESPQQS